jgi:hypothetical protein
MKSDNVRRDAASLGREFVAPPSVHETVYARVAERRSDVYRTGMSRIEYATELAALIRDSPMVEHAIRQRQGHSGWYSIAAAIAATKG